MQMAMQQQQLARHRDEGVGLGPWMPRGSWASIPEPTGITQGSHRGAVDQSWAGL